MPSVEMMPSLSTSSGASSSGASSSASSTSKPELAAAGIVKKAKIGAGGKELPELYKSTGNPRKDQLAFLHMLEQLKVQKRSGWIREGVTQPESVADHMYRMAVLCMLIPSAGLDIGRCVQMALVHDMAEAHVGDITPVEGVTAQTKHELEDEAMRSFLDEMLGGEESKEAREKIWSLWEEYEARETPESKLVKDMDRVELIMQAVEYERTQGVESLAPFFAGSLPHLQHPAVREWAAALMEERRLLWESRGKGKQERTGVEGVIIGGAVDQVARSGQ